MEENPTRICELIVGLGDVEVRGVDGAPGAPRPAQVAPVLSGGEPRGRVVHRGRRADRARSGRVDSAG